MQYEELVAAGAEAMTIFRNLSLIVASIAYSVGALGIAAIMTLSIYERIIEIGIRRAFGARRRDIFVHFLLEASILSVVGSFMGMLLSIGVVLTIKLAAEWPIVLPWTVLWLSIVLSILLALGAGLYPAYRAVGMEPKEVLQEM